jgi:hypothetical protein
MSTSQRASALVQQVPRNVSDRDRLREEWRLAAIATVHAEDAYERAKEGKAIFFDELVNTLIEQNDGLSVNKAERTARTSKAFKDYLNQMHSLRRDAKLAKIEESNIDRQYWESVSQEANERAERRMSR